MPLPRYFEDLQVGEKILTPKITISEADVLEFSHRFDPQPMHVDPEAAARGPFHGLIASGWHTAALVMRLTVDANPLGGEPLLGLGVDKIEWPKPVRPGDTIQVEIEVLEMTLSRSHPDHGIVKLESTARNQHGDIVYVVKPNCWVGRRPQ